MKTPFFRLCLTLAVGALFCWRLGRPPSVAALPTAATPNEADSEVRSLTQLHAAYPENSVYTERLAQAYERLHRYQEEAQAWEEFITHAPLPVEGCHALGKTYQKLNRQDQAMDAFSRCLEFDPSNADSLFLLGHQHEIAEHFDRAAELYKRGLKLAPDYPDLRLGLARLGLNRGDVAGAEATAHDVLRKFPQSGDAWFLLGQAAFRTGRLKEARDLMQRGMAIAPDNQDFRQALDRISEAEKHPQ